MPADVIEIEEAAEEGIERHNSVGPHEILVDERGQFFGVVFKRCTRVFDEQGRFSPAFDESELLTLQGDCLLLSVGQQVSFDFIDIERDGIRLDERGFVEVDPETGQSSSAPDIFVAGDCSYGPKLAVHALASGKKAARGIYGHLTGRAVTTEDGEHHAPIVGYAREANYEKIPRLSLPTLSASERRASLSKPVELSLDEEAARREASRCFDCGVNTIFDGEKCILCGGCVDVCPTLCLKLVPLAEIERDADIERLESAWNEDNADPALSAIIKDEERCMARNAEASQTGRDAGGVDSGEARASR
jgi:ferredoxin